MRILFLLALFLFSFISSFAQSYKTKDNANKKAMKFYLKGKELSRSNQDDKALASLEKAMAAEPRFIDAMIEWAGIKYNARDVDAAEKKLEEVIALAPYYNTKLLYTLGVIKKKKDDCNGAKKYYQQYIDAPKARTTLIEKSKKAIKDCDFAMNASSADFSAFDPQSISDYINTPDREYFPSLSVDGETFFFTRVVRNQEDIYYSRKTADGWGPAMPLDEINTDDNEANQSISADGKVIVFTACNRRDSGYGSCDLYLSEFKNGKWTPVRNMGRAINSSAWESQPSLSADGNLLFFSSKRSGNMGKADIYYSKRNAEGAWSLARPIKGKVNSKGEEQTPFLHQDGQTLYFKSTGHPGLGGYDIFYSKLQSDGTWGEPVNLGAPINSKSDEGSFYVSLDGQTAYFDSDKVLTKEGAGTINKNLHDIYSIQLDEKLRPEPVTYVKARVLDAETKEPLVAQVDFMNLNIQKRHAFNTTDKAGEFLVCLPAGKSYALNVSKTGYLFHSENFQLEKKGTAEQVFELEILLNRIPPAIASTPAPTKPNSQPTVAVAPTPIILKNIFFNTGSATLKSESTGELLKLLDLLRSNPKMNIQINGHTDNVGADAANMTLSENRAKSVYQFLVDRGISDQRLRYKGYGETQPIDSNDTPEGRQNNRRTEFIIINK